MTHFRKSEPKRAFTITEVLVVLVLISMLASTLYVVVGKTRMLARQAKCMSNERQIGIGLLGYTSDHGGNFPPTTHTTGSWRKDQSWIYQLSPYLGEVDEARVCPADPPARQERIRRTKSTSYVLNDLVFDDPLYQQVTNIPRPNKTLLLAILSEDRTPSVTRDHIHGGEWRSWPAILSDIEPDRHRIGDRAPDRTDGSANYLYADGHVENIRAKDFKAMVASGTNPAQVPEH